MNANLSYCTKNILSSDRRRQQHHTRCTCNVMRQQNVCSCIKEYVNIVNNFHKYSTIFKQHQDVTYSTGPSWPWMYGTWIYNYLCNLCLSPLTLWVRIPLMAMCTQYNIKLVSDLQHVGGFFQVLRFLHQ